MKLDFQIADDGPMVLLTPLTARAYQWVEANIREDREWFGGALLVKRAFAPELVNGMVGEGMQLGALSEAYKQ